MGIVKAAFVAQMLGHDVACLDSRNVEREGLPARQWRTDGDARKATRGHVRKVGRYIAATRGHARRYWNEWCAYVAQDYDLTPLAVSELHLAICKVESVSLEDTF